MAMPHPNAAVPETLITIKVTINNEVAKRLKVQLRDLSQQQMFPKLRQVLDIKPEQQMVVERYSDSAGGYITLDESNPQVFKTLIRAAKAKLKLRLKATVTPLPIELPQEKVIIERSTPAPRARESNKNYSRDSTAYDQRSVGSGIFQWREARASQQTLVNEEAPVPRPFTANQQPLIGSLADDAAKPELAFRTRTPSAMVAAQCCAWSVYCNACDKAMVSAHFHCSICDGGDYDLCEECVSRGRVCPGEGHWLIKRSIQDGKVVTSTTERIQPRKVTIVTPAVKPQVELEAQKEMPGAFTDESKTLAEEPRLATRTCNNCVIVLPEHEFVTCTVCADFDLCIKCHTDDKHGHHPGHGFQPATEETILPLAAETKLAPGRNVRHNAICDGCDKKIYGVRHKCMNCPDWDYCSDCVKQARTTHPRHRFAALFEPIADQYQPSVTHLGIYCDGPLCNGKSKQYIQGIRYKCTICHDTDYCASCEALPGNCHNRTHPLIKLKTPVRNVNISTESEDVRGNVRVMGDRSAQPATQNSVAEAAPSQPPQQAMTATPVQTVAEIKPTEVEEAMPSSSESVENIEQEAIGIPVKKFVQTTIPTTEVAISQLNAQFVCDYVPDGQVFEPETRFTQIWTMKNTGPLAWPSGCSVRFVGGDNMLNVENRHPASVTDIADASESNVVGREVAVGEEVAFKVTLKAPKREGKSISYWRLKAADGTPFGHRLWCDIEVKKAEAETTSAYPSTDAKTLNLGALNREITRLQRAYEKKTPECSSRAVSEAPAQQFSMPSGPATLPPMKDSMPRSSGYVPFRPHGSRVFSGPPMHPAMAWHHPVANSADQPPAYDASSMAGRLAAMREQQKQRREQMMAQMQAQRDYLHFQTLRGPEEPEVASSECQMNANAAATKKSAEEEKVKKIVEEATKVATESLHADVEPTANIDGSQMVFPKLEKESPESSTYESFTSHSDKGKAAYVENEDGEVEQSAAAPSVSSHLDREEDEFESVDGEIDVLSAIADSDDDGFVTDEEYDILDASDSETIA